jgi:hypothetical protein
MITLLKSNLERLEANVTSTKSALDKVAAQHEAAAAHAKHLADSASDAFADGAQNASDIELKSAQAELRARSLAAAVEKAIGRWESAVQAFEDEKLRLLREASAAKLTKAAGALEKQLAPTLAAIDAMIVALDGAGFQEIVSTEAPPRVFAANIHACRAALVGGDGRRFVDTLRTYAKLIESGIRPHTLAKTMAESDAEYAASMKKKAS